MSLDSSPLLDFDLHNHLEVWEIFKRRSACACAWDIAQRGVPKGAGSSAPAAGVLVPGARSPAPGSGVLASG